MKLVAFCSLKGGTGKTTLSFNLAERAAAAGLRAALVDFDPQEGSLGLMDLRDGEGWPALRGQVSVSGVADLAGLKEGGEYDVVFCDLPGADSMALGRLLWEMDLVLSPVGAGAADLMAAANFQGMVGKMDSPVVFLPNNLPYGRNRKGAMLAELELLGVEVCPVVLYRRVAHLDALRAGLGVCELDGECRAAAEVCELWEWVQGRLGIL